MHVPGEAMLVTVLPEAALEPASKAFLQPNTPPSGYAIAFPTYSTWEGPCMYLEDLLAIAQD